MIDAGGVGPGWVRTGERFRVWPMAAVVTDPVEVCRFFGVAARGPEAHFFTVHATECAASRNDPTWSFEGLAFRALLPTRGACAAGFDPVVRLFWNGTAGTQMRHRYVVDPAVVGAMANAAGSSRARCSARLADPPADSSRCERLRGVSAEPSFLDPSGPLEVVRDEQTGRNQLGRARLDADGRLRPSLRTRRIVSAAEASGADFLVGEQVMSAADCARVIAAFAALRDRVVKDDPVDRYWSGRYLWAADLADAQPEALRIMREATDRARGLVQRFYALEAPLYNDLFQLVQWPTGLSMRPHADRANPDGSPHRMSHRHYAGTLYLNDDYDGGELYFTALDVAIKPRRGMFVGFTGGFRHEHAVTRIESGAVRMTMPSFYSFDPRHADPLVHPGVAAAARAR